MSDDALLIWHRQARTSRRQAGVTLVEALVALVVMSFGMIALVSLMSNLRLGSDLAKQRGEAVRLAQSELEMMRSYSQLSSTSASVVSFDDSATALDSIKSGSRSERPDNSNTTFTITRTVDPIKVDGVVVAKSVRVSVTWVDRTGKDGSAEKAGTPQSVTLDTWISRVDPAFAGAVGIEAPATGARQPGGRHPAIPLTAKDLGNKKSVFRPSAASEAVWVFNNVTGVIVGKCSIATSTLIATLTAEDVDGCSEPTTGFLLSGTIRFSNTNPANPAFPEAAAFHIDDLEITSGTYYTARIGVDKLPVKDASGAVVMDPVSVTPPTHKCFNDSPATPGTQMFVNYSCLVEPDASTKLWSGKLVLTGLSVGTTSSDYRVCRYSADYNGNGTQYTKTDNYVIDNYEHPAVYANVSGSLVRQNFLVVKGNVACPTAPAVSPLSGIFVDYSTQQLQPDASP